ncbi:hypothetical protein C4J81_17225 [Deltaproteobacteria bacterium Smac51]|nr:hypothetical protein C4J81_17225 [Deltaproteobacteria bacterium Smac51]
MPESAKILQFPQPLEKMETAALVDMAAAIKEEITTQTEKLRQINLILVDRAIYKSGSKTGYAAGRHYSAKVQIKENESWDQEKLEAARTKMGDVDFFRVFKWDFRPVSAKILSGAIEFGAHAELLKAARTIKPGAPQVSFDLLEE